MNPATLDLTRLPFPYADVDASLFQPSKGPTSLCTPWQAEPVELVWALLALASEAAAKRERREKLREDLIPEAEELEAHFGTAYSCVSRYEAELRDVDAWLEARGFGGGL